MHVDWRNNDKRDWDASVTVRMLNLINKETKINAQELFLQGSPILEVPCKYGFWELIWWHIYVLENDEPSPYGYIRRTTSTGMRSLVQTMDQICSRVSQGIFDKILRVLVHPFYASLALPCCCYIGDLWMKLQRSHAQPCNLALWRTCWQQE
ncbi:hypothetical protein VNO77_07942 [Canavalia gladiata]|uniref:Uncharacterized protein n=1 Tax=Canavalia gladiata TaxID=3824 RepID=A0AAN9M8V2_CANGL